MKGVAFVSKPMDLYNLRLVIPENTNLNIIVFNYISNNNTFGSSYLKLCSILFENISYSCLEIKQFNLYSLPYINSYFLNRELNLVETKVSYDNLFKRSDSSFNFFSRGILFIFYSFIRLLNRFLLSLKLSNESQFDTLYTDPFPYKLGNISLFKFNNLVFYDGGQSVKTFNFLKLYEKGLPFFIQSIYKSKYSGLLTQNDVLFISSKESLFFTRYVEEVENFGDNHNFISLQENNFFDFAKSVKYSSGILILGSNFPDEITINYLSKIRALYCSDTLYYRPHPREIITTKLILFCNCNYILLSFPLYGMEIDILMGHQPITNSIIHFNSSAKKTLSTFNDLNFINYYDIS